MKSFDDLDKKIDKYYDGSIEDINSNELELKATLDKMSLINGIENNISVPIDIRSIVEKGQQTRLNNKLRKATIKFLSLAILLSILIGFMCTKVSILVIMTYQFVMLIILLLLNSILLKKKVRSEGSDIK